ncbi:MAG: putative DNA-binding protein [Clostridiales bacterium]|uniref:putative DNA-binding protein n=1 Tax=Clostridium sp. N3C TaxID=1776758 RepID=UPI00092E1BF2|nr:putative DNA-binding protein [Clostridium sp. N3C]NLZ48600.1 putative DNA-binding protein [Clostridiales bacterium]SCN21964.1 putative DNA-binding protein [Clostridium sp. N3C]
MEDHIEMSMLMDFYGTLLTDKQQEIMNLYYNENLSLAEISELTNTSRQAVHDIIKRCHKLLLEYEVKLKLKENVLKKIEKKKTAIKYLEDIKKDSTEPVIIEKIDRLEEIFKDL